MVSSFTANSSCSLLITSRRFLFSLSSLASSSRRVMASDLASSRLSRKAYSLSTQVLFIFSIVSLRTLFSSTIAFVRSANFFSQFRTIYQCCCSFSWAMTALALMDSTNLCSLLRTSRKWRSCLVVMTSCSMSDLPRDDRSWVLGIPWRIRVRVRYWLREDSISLTSSQLLVICSKGGRIQILANLRFIIISLRNTLLSKDSRPETPTQTYFKFSKLSSLTLPQYALLLISQLLSQASSDLWSYIVCMHKSLRKRIFNQASSLPTSHRFEFRVAWGGVPHPDKAFKGGQDAMFASKNVLVVADGVSGWSKIGIDPSVYSRRLVTHVKQLLESQDCLYYLQHPDELAVKAVQLTEEKGSSTLTIITLHPLTGVVRTYHVGDSIYGIFRRNGSRILASEQQKQFDMPFQVFGGKINAIQTLQRGEHLVSDVFRGEYNQFSFTEIGGSQLIVASDGLWDNLHIKQIEETLLQEDSDLTEKARLLLQRTVYCSSLSEYNSPYYLKGVAKGLPLGQGGKPDDVSIILAEVMTIEP